MRADTNSIYQKLQFTSEIKVDNEIKCLKFSIPKKQVFSKNI